MTRQLARPRLGVAGAGSLGFHHVRIARDLPGAELAGFFDASEARAKEVSETLQVSATDSLEELLDRVDALIIVTPTAAHEPVAIQALERGIHVFIEKPIAPSIESADRILDAARRGGALVQVGHVERFNAAVQAAQPFLDRPLFVESHRLAPFTARGTDVAVVLDLMIHDVDLISSLVGHPIRDLRATGVPVLTASVDIANARLEFEGGAVANLTASRVSMERMRKLRIFQRSGYLSLNLADGSGEFLRLREELPALQFEGSEGDDLPRALGDRDLASLVERIPLRSNGAEPLRLEQENFVEAIRGQGAPAVTGEEGREALAVALDIESRILAHVADSRSQQA
jgi:predicted dehydrogenase